jgi:hypothetical protein
MFRAYCLPALITFINDVTSAIFSSFKIKKYKTTDTDTTPINWIKFPPAKRSRSSQIGVITKPNIRINLR